MTKMRYRCRENGVLDGEKKAELLRDLELEIIKRQVNHRAVGAEDTESYKME